MKQENDSETLGLLEERGGSVDPCCFALENEEEDEWEIDRDVDGTFPASDPPGWSLGIESSYTRHTRDRNPDGETP